MINIRMGYISNDVLSKRMEELTIFLIVILDFFSAL